MPRGGHGMRNLKELTRNPSPPETEEHSSVNESLRRFYERERQGYVTTRVLKSALWYLALAAIVIGSVVWALGVRK